MKGLAFGLGSMLCLVAVGSQAESWTDFAKRMMQQPATQQALSNSDIAAGLKEALAQGTRVAVTQLGRTDGYWADNRFRIPLPLPVARLQTALQSVGMGAQLDALHLAVNRAAEQAVPVAADVFAEAVNKLTLTDVQGILSGAPDAATQYFKRATSATLTGKFRPIVSMVTAKVGLVQQYDRLMQSAGPMAALVGTGQTDLDGYVTQKALDGLYARVAQEEKTIRTNPAARGSEILKRVFGSTATR